MADAPKKGRLKDKKKKPGKHRHREEKAAKEAEERATRHAAREAKKKKEKEDRELRRKEKEQRRQQRDLYSRVRKEMRERRKLEEELRLKRLAEEAAKAKADAMEKAKRLEKELARKKAANDKLCQEIDYSCRQRNVAFQRVRGISMAEHAPQCLGRNEAQQIITGTRDGNILVYEIPNLAARMLKREVEGKQDSHQDSDFALVKNVNVSPEPISSLFTADRWQMVCTLSEHGVACFDMNTFKPRKVCEVNGKWTHILPDTAGASQMAFNDDSSYIISAVEDVIAPDPENEFHLEPVWHLIVYTWNGTKFIQHAFHRNWCPQKPMGMWLAKGLLFVGYSHFYGMVDINTGDISTYDILRTDKEIITGSGYETVLQAPVACVFPSVNEKVKVEKKEKTEEEKEAERIAAMQTELGALQGQAGDLLERLQADKARKDVERRTSQDLDGTGVDGMRTRPGSATSSRGDGERAGNGFTGLDADVSVAQKAADAAAGVAAAALAGSAADSSAADPATSRIGGDETVGVPQAMAPGESVWEKRYRKQQGSGASDYTDFSEYSKLSDGSEAGRQTTGALDGDEDTFDEEAGENRKGSVGMGKRNRRKSSDMSLSAYLKSKGKEIKKEEDEYELITRQDTLLVCKDRGIFIGLDRQLSRSRTIKWGKLLPQKLGYCHPFIIAATGKTLEIYHIETLQMVQVVAAADAVDLSISYDLKCVFLLGQCGALLLRRNAPILPPAEGFLEKPWHDRETMVQGRKLNLTGHYKMQLEEGMVMPPDDERNALWREPNHPRALKALEEGQDNSEEGEDKEGEEDGEQKPDAVKAYEARVGAEAARRVANETLRKEQQTAAERAEEERRKKAAEEEEVVEALRKECCSIAGKTLLDAAHASAAPVGAASAAARASRASGSWQGDRGDRGDRGGGDRSTDLSASSVRYVLKVVCCGDESLARSKLLAKISNSHRSSSNQMTHSPSSRQMLADSRPSSNRPGSRGTRSAGFASVGPHVGMIDGGSVSPRSAGLSQSQPANVGVVAAKGGSEPAPMSRMQLRAIALEKERAERERAARAVAAVSNRVRVARWEKEKKRKAQRPKTLPRIR
jgi:hypothetical protein